MSRSDDRKTTCPEVNWGEIIGLRTMLAHIYHRIDIENIWGAASALESGYEVIAHVCGNQK